VIVEASSLQRSGKSNFDAKSKVARHVLHNGRIFRFYATS
jgi:hypothetical protein